MTDEKNEPKKSRFSNLPSFVWIFIIIGGIIALIGGVLGLFYGISSVEGFASILLLVVAWVIIRATTGTSQSKSQGDGLITAIGIMFFALMGMAIDQPGNVIYNKPIEVFFCPAGSQLTRDIDVSHPLPGRTDVTQDFVCVEPRDHTPVQEINVGQVILVRFVEYILIGYVLIYLSKLYSRLRRRSVPIEQSSS